jgi:flagellar hook-length control protein FliK
MTATTGAAPNASSSQSQASNGNNAARQAGGSAASSRPGQGHRNAADVFANLLGLLSATNEAPTALGASAADAIDISSGQDTTDALGNLLPDGSANPLADLIGWAGAPASAAAGPSTGPALSTANAASDAMVGKGIVSDAAATPSGSDADNGISLQGMAVLAQPTAADASVLAGLKSGALPTAPASPPASPDSVNVSFEASAQAQANHPASAQRANTIAASRPANWRSTAALGSSSAVANAPASSPTSTTSIQIAQSAVGLRGREISAASPSRSSGVALDDRFSSAVSTETSAPGTALGSAQPHSSQDNPHPSGNGEAGFGGTSTSEAYDLDAPDQAFSLEAELSPEEELDPNAFLSPDQLRYANVRVGGGTEEAIDIRLSLEGDAVNVNFRTDNAEVRAGLQHNAGGPLSDLMQRSGLQLGGVSVGAQSQQPSGQSGQSGHPSGQSNSSGSPGRSNISGSSDRSQAPSGLERAPVTRRADGGPALDVFA